MCVKSAKRARCRISIRSRSEEHTSELQSRSDLVCRLLLEKKNHLTNDLMDYQISCLDLTPAGKTLIDTEVTRVSNLWLATVGNTAKATQGTTLDMAVGHLS